MARTPVDPADPLFGPLQEKARRELLKYIVGRCITCARTGQVLDYRTCVVFVDNDGDPSYAMSQDGWREVVAQQAHEGRDAATLLSSVHGLHLDRSTVKGA